ncbi:hypothetical protein [Saccharothrix texasensis]|uniref:Uncharacterized protein n=1 Tax=Saccharothrix texasensis TaxID=103734 RepID=A0A3N1H959_9PSEU|nr:hypothetical protein [Saccharothrix texasensis]ROP38971.1 hypothetical protein EDD40_4338 [Saccharothrix texasensis]
MADRVVPYDVFYVPWSLGDREAMAQYAATWLREQPGAPLVLFPNKSSSGADRTLTRLTTGAAVAWPRNLGRASSWSTGPVLAPWPTGDVLELLSEELRSKVTALCVLEWGDSDQDCINWLAGHHARSVVDGQVHPRSEVRLDPVVEVAMSWLEQSVNHGNSLAGVLDRRDAIETLQVLHKAGYRYDVDDLCIWSYANGFNFSEVERLREFAEGVAQGKRFQLKAGRALRSDIVEVWRAEAEGR